MQSSDKMLQRYKRVKVHCQSLQATGVRWRYFAPAATLPSLAHPFPFSSISPLSHVLNTSMVGFETTAQNERYVSGIFANEEKIDEE
jgi:hypothetical protein